MRVRPRDTPSGAPASAHDVLPAAPARAGTLFHLLQLAAAPSEAAGVDDVAGSLTDQMRPSLGTDGLALMVANKGRLHVVGSRGSPQHKHTVVFLCSPARAIHRSLGR